MLRLLGLLAVWFAGVALTKADDIAVQCRTDEFPCDDGRECVSKMKWCDSAGDCRDYSDEDMCLESYITKNPNHCGIRYFVCAKGPCIPAIGRCDGFESCRDGSDEANCTFSYAREEPRTLHLADASIPSTLEPTRLTESSTRHPDATKPSKIQQYSSVVQATPVLQSPNSQKPTAHNNLSPRYFRPLSIQQYSSHISLAQKWLISQRDEDFGWSEETPRATIALYLSDPKYFKNTTDHSLLMSKQLQLNLIEDILKNDTNSENAHSKTLSLSSLSLYVNALLATCNNPRHFHGLDLVQTLRQRTDHAQEKGKFVNPFVYLTLCNVNATSHLDMRKLMEMTRSKTTQNDRLDMHALMVMAASCIDEIPTYSNMNLRVQVATSLLHMLSDKGHPGDVYTTALVVQALNAAKVDPQMWGRTDLVNALIHSQDVHGSFGDVLATYYTLPVLSGRSLVSLRRYHCQGEENGLVGYDEDNKRKLAYVQYSLHFKNPVEVSQTVQLRVPEGTKFLDVMHRAGDINPNFRCKYYISSKEPLVYAIGGIANDAEQGFHWSLFHSSKKDNFTGIDGHLIPYTEDLRNLVHKSEEHVVFWYREG